MTPALGSGEIWAYDDIQRAAPEVVHPNDPAALVTLLEDLASEGDRTRRVTVRAGGHAFDGQALNNDLVLAMDAPAFCKVDAPVPSPGSPSLYTLRAGAGATWMTVLHTAAAAGCVPLSVVTGSTATVGGTLSADCLSRFSPVYGRESGWLVDLDIASPIPGRTGIETLLGPRHPGYIPDPPGPVSDPYAHASHVHAAVGGMGYTGVITAATMTLLKVAQPGERIAVETRLTTLPRSFPWEDLLRPLKHHVARHSPVVHAARTAGEPVAVPPPALCSSFWYPGGQRRAALMEYRYVVTQERKPYGPNQPDHVLRVPVEWGMAFPWVNTLTQEVFFALMGREGRYVDDLEGFTFFYDGNTRAKAAAARCLGRRLTTFQQTFILPDDDPEGNNVESTARAMDRIEGMFLSRGLIPAILDVLYVKRDTEPFLLSSTRTSGGFAVSLAYESFRPGGRPGVPALFRDISALCLDPDVRGLVSLVKHVHTNPGDLQAMYGPALDRFRVLKSQHDPRGLLQNGFYDRTLAAGAKG